MKKRKQGLIFLAILALLLSGCAENAEKEPEQTKVPFENEQKAQKPALPEKLETDDAGIPILEVYQADEEAIKEMDIETYLLGVLAGEMKNDWPMEALKAQAILARTFVMKFCTEKESKYQGADISTDIEEAQAYDDTGINERIERAVKETEGLVLSYQGKLPYAWFHAHSGGSTALAREGLGYNKAEPGYTQVTAGRESAAAPQEAREWRAVFSEEEVMKAARKAGLATKDSRIDTIKIGKTGESGRAETLLINGMAVSAPEMRIALGSSAMRSTLLSKLVKENGQVIMEGKGYGHGVGMPQWGAYGMAEEGKKAEEIVSYYFKDVTIEKLW